MKFNSSFLLPQKAVKLLADKYGTPLLVLSTKQVENNYYFLQKHMPRVKIHYAVKANPDSNIVKKLAQIGSYFDVASSGEIRDLHAMGIDGSKMVYANPFKTTSGLDACNESNVDRFTFDSESELEKIAQKSPNAKVLLRVRIDNSSAVVDLNKKFGAAPERTLYLLNKAKELGLNAIGLCFHVGSQVFNSDPYINALNKTRELFDQVKEQGHELTVLDIGGGYPVPSISDDIKISQMLTEINDCIEKLFPETEIWSEPGRFICATTMSVITRVIGTTERNGKPWYYLDEGVYGTFSGVLFDHWEYEFISFKDVEFIPATFAGPSCDSLDVICCDRMTAPLNMNDLLFVPSCGAYSSASATTFNGFEKAKTVVWEEVRAELGFADVDYASAV